MVTARRSHGFGIVGPARAMSGAIQSYAAWPKRLS